MEYYTVEIDDEIFDNQDNNITDYTPSEYSKYRYDAVIHQLDNIWYKVYKQVLFIRNTTDIDASNLIMKNMYKLFMIEFKASIEYYSEYNMKKRAKPRYKINKINRMRYRLSF